MSARNSIRPKQRSLNGHRDQHYWPSYICVCVQGHNLVYLHVNYNTFRLAFWVLAHLLNAEEALVAVTSEIDDVIASRDRVDDDVITLNMDDVNSLHILGTCYCQCLSVCRRHRYGWYLIGSPIWCAFRDPACVMTWKRMLRIHVACFDGAVKSIVHVHAWRFCLFSSLHVTCGVYLCEM